MKKLLAALGALALVLGLVALVASPASAHNHTVDANCVAGVSVNLTNYNTGQANANHVTVTIDDAVVTNQTFGGSFAKVYPFSTGHGTHHYRVAATAYDDQSASSGWTFDTGTKTVTGCETPVTPAVALSNDAVCTAAGTVDGGGYTIPAAQVGVAYQLWDARTNGWIAIGSGSHAATPGSVIKIQAVPTDGYKLTGTTAWTLTIGSPNTSNCVVPVAPTPNYSQCTGTPGGLTTASYTIPAIEAGYRLFLQGGNTPLNAGKVTVSTFPTTVVLVAKTTSPYLFPTTATTKWTFTFQSPGDCHATATPADVKPQYSACDAPGTSTTNGFTVVATEGVIYQLKTGATWTTLTAGFHDLGKSAGSVEIQAIADANYALTGTTDWKFSFSSASDCLVAVSGGDPKFVEASCDVDHPGTVVSGSYLVTKKAGVHYEAKVNGGTTTILVPGVVNPAKPGDVVVITPIADPGYIISPVIAPEKLTHTFSAVANSCLLDSAFVHPQVTSQSCVVTGGNVDSGTDGTATLKLAFITIPSLDDSPHAVYFINFVKAGPGQHILDPGTYTVSAMPETGYAFKNYDGPWTEVLTSAEPCGDLITHPLVDPAAVQVQMGCFTDGSYTLSNDLSDAAALTWTVNGSTVSQGSYRVSTAGIVKVHVVANGPDYGLEPAATTDWTFDFERPTTCDLKTLALTGSSPTGWIALGYAMLVSGLALLALRFSRRRRDELG